jgi:large subunit ribosomal protein L10e
MPIARKQLRKCLGEFEFMGIPKGMSYTRRKYIHSVPQSKINRFTLGNTTAQYEYIVSLISSNSVRINSNALESARVTTNKALTNMLGERAYRLKVVTYPHEVVREHKFMSFAGADRLSQGMGHAFGRPTSRAARIGKGRNIISVFVNKNGIDAAKKALKKSSKKLPIKYSVVVKQIVGLTQEKE